MIADTVLLNNVYQSVLIFFGYFRPNKPSMCSVAWLRVDKTRNIMSLPNNSISDWSKLEVFADDNINRPNTWNLLW